MQAFTASERGDHGKKTKTKSALKKNSVSTTGLFNVAERG